MRRCWPTAREISGDRARAAARAADGVPEAAADRRAARHRRATSSSRCSSATARDKAFFADARQARGARRRADDADAHRHACSRDEEHQALRAGRSRIARSGYPRHHRIDLDFVTTGEFRTLADSYHEIKDITFPVVVKSTDASRDERRAGGRPATAAADDTAIGGGAARRGDQARGRAEGRDASSMPKAEASQDVDAANRSTSWSSSSSPPARRASPSTATRAWAR